MPLRRHSMAPWPISWNHYLAFRWSGPGFGRNGMAMDFAWTSDAVWKMSLSCFEKAVLNTCPSRIFPPLIQFGLEWMRTGAGSFPLLRACAVVNTSPLLSTQACESSAMPVPPWLITSRAICRQQEAVLSWRRAPLHLHQPLQIGRCTGLLSCKVRVCSCLSPLVN